MALNGARFIDAHPATVLVVLAGIEHVANGHGIPARLLAMTDMPGVVVLSDASASASVFAPANSARVLASARTASAMAVSCGCCVWWR